MTDLSLICSNEETIPARRRGAPPGNTNALRHGRYSQRFNPQRLQSLLSQPSAPQDAAAPGSPLVRHLAILQATIEDLAQAAGEGQGPALTALAQSLDYPNARRLRNNPEGHTKCAACETWCQNRFLSPQGLCRRCVDS